MSDFSAIFYFSCFLITQCIRIPFRISKLSIFKPLFSQQLLITLFLATLTSPCPTRFANGSSIASMNQSTSLLLLEISRRISFPPGRRHLLTESKKALMMKAVGTDDHVKGVIREWKILAVSHYKSSIWKILLLCLLNHCRSKV